MFYPKGVERGEAFRRGIVLLKDAGIDNPALDASVLLGFVTGEDAVIALMERGRTMSPDETALYEELIKRRCQRETLSRITGQKEFYSKVFVTNPDVLDPRPATETLVEKALHHLVTLCGQPKVLDIGTGSGAIAVTLAAENKNLTVTATDISQAALRTAVSNAFRYQVSDRIDFVCTDLAAGLVDSARFDLVVSNPPYVSHQEYEALAPEVLKGDPVVALVAGPQGTEFYPALANAAKRLLKPGGYLFVEVGAGQEGRVETLFRNSGFEQVREYADLSGVPRVVKGKKPHG